MDDSMAWVTGPSAGANVQRLQATLIPQVKRWEASGGAIFQQEKTGLTHFTGTLRRAADVVLLVVSWKDVPGAFEGLEGVHLDIEPKTLIADLLP